MAPTIRPPLADTFAVTTVAGGPGNRTRSHKPPSDAASALELAMPDPRLPAPHAAMVVDAPDVDASRAAAAGARATRSTTQPREVIGPDDRKRVLNPAEYPWSAICNLSITAADGATLIGTGWLAGPRLLVTAGHCVFLHARGGWVKSVSVFAADARGAAPLARAKTFRSVAGWVNHRSLAADYGAVLLDTPIGDSFGCFGYATVADEGLRQSTVNIAGYPDDKSPSGSLWWHARQIQQATAAALFYDVDTSGGQSGAPVWRNANGRRTAIGIHGNGSDRANMAVRITADVVSNLQKWNREAERA